MTSSTPPQTRARVPEGHRLVFDDDFDRGTLDESKWCRFYLPHWSSREASRPSYRLRDGVLRLYIADDQAPWCPALDGRTRVSNLQTGHFSGPLGSAVGQHRFDERLVVRDAFPPCRLFVPRFCRLEMRARARLGPDNLAALWLIGFEDTPERSGEITVMELFGHRVRDDAAVVVRGIKRINDPDLVDELAETELPIRVSDWHTYAIDWSADGVRFLVDGEEVTASGQSPDYPMQLMLNFYDLGGASPAGDAAWFDIDFIRAYQRL